jgi:hypothetical protein
MQLLGLGNFDPEEAKEFWREEGVPFRDQGDPKRKDIPAPEEKKKKEIEKNLKKSPPKNSRDIIKEAAKAAANNTINKDKGYDPSEWSSYASYLASLQSDALEAEAESGRTGTELAAKKARATADKLEASGTTAMSGAGAPIVVGGLAAKAVWDPARGGWTSLPTPKAPETLPPAKVKLPRVPWRPASKPVIPTTPKVPTVPTDLKGNPLPRNPLALEVPPRGRWSGLSSPTTPDAPLTPTQKWLRTSWPPEVSNPARVPGAPVTIKGKTFPGVEGARHTPPTPEQRRLMQGGNPKPPLKPTGLAGGPDFGTGQVNPKDIPVDDLESKRRIIAENKRAALKAKQAAQNVAARKAAAEAAAEIAERNRLSGLVKTPHPLGGSQFNPLRPPGVPGNMPGVGAVTRANEFIPGPPIKGPVSTIPNPNYVPPKPIPPRPTPVPPLSPKIDPTDLLTRGETPYRGSTRLGPDAPRWRPPGSSTPNPFPIEAPPPTVPTTPTTPKPSTLSRLGGWLKPAAKIASKVALPLEFVGAATAEPSEAYRPEYTIPTNEGAIGSYNLSRLGGEGAAGIAGTLIQTPAVLAENLVGNLSEGYSGDPDAGRGHLATAAAPFSNPVRTIAEVAGGLNAVEELALHYGTEAATAVGGAASTLHENVSEGLFGGFANWVYNSKGFVPNFILPRGWAAGKMANNDPRIAGRNQQGAGQESPSQELQRLLEAQAAAAALGAVGGGIAGGFISQRIRELRSQLSAGAGSSGSSSTGSSSTGSSSAGSSSAGSSSGGSSSTGSSSGGLMQSQNARSLQRTGGAG